MITDKTTASKENAEFIHGLLNRAIALARQHAESKRDSLRVICEEAFYFDEQQGVFAIVAFLNGREYAEQVMGVTLSAGNVESKNGSFNSELVAAPPSLVVARLNYLNDPFPIRLRANEAALGAMFFAADVKAQIMLRNSFNLSGDITATANFTALRASIESPSLKLRRAHR